MIPSTKKVPALLNRIATISSPVRKFMKAPAAKITNFFQKP